MTEITLYRGCGDTPGEVLAKGSLVAEKADLDATRFVIEVNVTESPEHLMAYVGSVVVQVFNSMLYLDMKAVLHRTKDGIMQAEVSGRAHAIDAVVRRIIRKRYQEIMDL